MARRVKAFYRRGKGKVRPDIRLHRDHRTDTTFRTKSDRERQVHFRMIKERKRERSMDREIKASLSLWNNNA